MTETIFAYSHIRLNECAYLLGCLYLSILKTWLAVYREITKDNLGLFSFQRAISKLPSLQRVKLVVKA